MSWTAASTSPSIATGRSVRSYTLTMSVGTRLIAVIAFLPILVLGASSAQALSCEAPEYWYAAGKSRAGDVLIVEGEGWSRGSDDECDGSPYGDVRIFVTVDRGDRVLVARGAADDRGQFVANVPIPRTLSGRVHVEVIASASVPVAGVTMSTPLMIETDSNSSAFDPIPVAFGPVHRTRASGRGCWHPVSCPRPRAPPSHGESPRDASRRTAPGMDRHPPTSVRELDDLRTVAIGRPLGSRWSARTVGPGRRHRGSVRESDGERATTRRVRQCLVRRAITAWGVLRLSRRGREITAPRVRGVPR
jgi:hypothetical protein